ncbi:hypothetical protein ACJ73_09738, partial [Blastomyces percursus]
ESKNDDSGRKEAEGIPAAAAAAAAAEEAEEAEEAGLGSCKLQKRAARPR